MQTISQLAVRYLVRLAALLGAVSIKPSPLTVHQNAWPATVSRHSGAWQGVQVVGRLVVDELMQHGLCQHAKWHFRKDLSSDEKEEPMEDSAVLTTPVRLPSFFEFRSMSNGNQFIDTTQTC